MPTTNVSNHRIHHRIKMITDAADDSNDSNIINPDLFCSFINLLGKTTRAFYYSAPIYNIDFLSNHINIAKTIILAKLNIIPKFILSSDELEHINKLFSKYSPSTYYQINPSTNFWSYRYIIKATELYEDSYSFSHIIPPREHK